MGLHRMYRIEKVFIHWGILSYVAMLLITIVTVKEGGEYIKKVPEHLTCLIGKESTEDYLSKNIQPYKMFNYINKELPVSSKLLFVWENRGFYCNREYVADLIYEASWIIPFIYNMENPDKLLNKLKSMEITHLLYNQTLGNVFRPSFSAPQQNQDFILSMKILEEFLGKYTRLIYQDNGVLLFEIYEPKK